MARKQGGGMTVAEAGRMGGRLVSEKYGPEFYEKIGKKGGSSTASKYGPEFFGRIGKKGGKAVTALPPFLPMRPKNSGPYFVAVLEPPFLPIFS